MRRAAVLFGAVLSGFLFCADALADAPPEERAAADKLFNDAVKLAEAGDYAKACPKFEASQALDPAIGTLVNLGVCYAEIGRFASSWASFNSCVGMAVNKKDKREADCRARAQAIEPRLTLFTIEVPKEVDAPDLVVRRDGKAVARELWGTAVPVDPGDHVIEAARPDHEPWKTTIVADKPGPLTTRIPALAPSKVKAPKGVATGEPKAPEPYVPFFTTPRILAVNAVGLGLVGIGLGAGFGADALGKTGAAKDHCYGGSPLRCDADGQSLYSNAKTSALASDIGFIAGGVLLAGGVVLWLVSPKASGDKPKEPQKAAVGVTPTPGGLVVRGSW